ncbi:MAG: calcium-binding protein [Pseudomonadota bacterium]
MPDIVITSDTVTTTAQDLSTTADAIFLLSNKFLLANTLGNGVTGSGTNQTFLIAGTLSADGQGVVASGEDARISVTGDMITDSSGISLNGINGSVSLSGSITASGNGITASGVPSEILVTSSGSIYSDDFGIRIGASFGPSSVSTGNVTNAGVISGSDLGIGITQSAYINNSGVISKTGSDDFLGFAAAIMSYSGSNQTIWINNTGDIIGSAYFLSSGELVAAESVRIENGNGNTLVLFNAGNMLGNVTSGEMDDEITNSGEILGDVDLAGGADEMSNSGTIDGAVDLGDQNDVFENAGTGFVSGLVSGGAGEDTITGGTLGDDFEGGDDNDNVIGRAGDDTLAGGSGDDTVLGGSGADNLRGDSGADVLNGQSGNDTLIGGGGDDRLFGGQGNDDITAGEGADILRGDGGQDVFIFNSTAETGTGSTRDRILGWEDGADLIDLSGFGALEFSATGAVGGGTASVWFDAVSGGAQTMLRIDADGNGSFDGQVLLVRADPALFDQSDLILA